MNKMNVESAIYCSFSLAVKFLQHFTQTVQSLILKNKDNSKNLFLVYMRAINMDFPIIHTSILFNLKISHRACAFHYAWK